MLPPRIRDVEAEENPLARRERLLDLHSLQDVRETVHRGEVAHARLSRRREPRDDVLGVAHRDREVGATRLPGGYRATRAIPRDNKGPARTRLYLRFLGQARRCV